MDESSQEDKAQRRQLTYSKVLANASGAPFDGKKLADHLREINRTHLRSVLALAAPPFEGMLSHAVQELNSQLVFAARELLNPWSDIAIDFMEAHRLWEAEIDARIAEAAAVLGVDVDALPDHWTLDDLEERAEAAKLTRAVLLEGTPEAVSNLNAAIAKWSARATRDGNRVKPGPQPRTMEEVIEMVEKWRRWKQSGHSQQEFADHMGWESRTILTDCIAAYRKEFGANSI